MLDSQSLGRLSMLENSSLIMLGCFKSIDRKEDGEEPNSGWRTGARPERRPPTISSSYSDGYARNDELDERRRPRSDSTATSSSSGGPGLEATGVESHTRLVRRDRSRQFKATRSALLAAALSNTAPRHDCTWIERSAETELARIYSEASDAHNSVAAKIVQHDGVRQFCEENRNRAPPFEFRAELPKIEASIEELLRALTDLNVQLHDLEVPSSSRFAGVRDNVAKYIEDAHEKYSRTFAAQRTQLQELAEQSRMFSPLIHSISPTLHKRLSDSSKGSPVVSKVGSPALSMATTASPMLSGTSSMPPSAKSTTRLPLDAFDSDDGEDEIVLRSSPPFDSLFSPPAVTR